MGLPGIHDGRPRPDRRRPCKQCGALVGALTDGLCVSCLVAQPLFDVDPETVTLGCESCGRRAGVSVLIGDDTLPFTVCVACATFAAEAATEVGSPVRVGPLVNPYAAV